MNRTLYSPATGAPVLVPEMAIADFLRAGYQTQAPPPPVAETAKETALAPAAIVKSEEPSSEKESSPKLIDSAVSESGAVNVNQAGLKVLSDVLNIGTGNGRLVIANRPYSNIEDLISKVPGCDWASLSSKISF